MASTSTALWPLAPLLSRLAASVPGPRHHTVRYAGVLASASKVRSLIAPKKTEAEAQQCTHRPCEHAEPSASSEAGQADAESRSRGAYRPWAELLKRSFGFDILVCPNHAKGCQGRMRMVAMVTDPKEVARYLRSIGEPTEMPKQAPARGPPYWQSQALRRRDLGPEAA
jgi:hypothetical protein